MDLSSLGGGKGGLFRRKGGNYAKSVFADFKSLFCLFLASDGLPQLLLFDTLFLLKFLLLRLNVFHIRF